MKEKQHFNHNRYVVCTFLSNKCSKILKTWTRFWDTLRVTDHHETDSEILFKNKKLFLYFNDDLARYLHRLL